MTIQNQSWDCYCCNCDVQGSNSPLTHVQGMYYCENCLHELCMPCSQCGRLMDRRTSLCWIHQTEVYCSIDCLEAADLSVCADCGEILSADDRYYHEDHMVYYCEDCYRQVPDTNDTNEERGFRRVRIVEEEFAPGRATYGFEVEYCTLENVPHVRDLPDNWGIHADTSTCSGREVVTDTMYLTEIPEKLGFFRRYPDKTCSKEGLHMHIGNFLDVLHALNFAKLCLGAEELFVRTLNAKSRHNNSYCYLYDDERRLEYNSDFVLSDDHIVTDIGAKDRYRAVNLAAYREHGTIEIRSHQGTTDPEKMLLWATFFDSVYEMAKTTGEWPYALDFPELLDCLRLPREPYMARVSALGNLHHIHQRTTNRPLEQSARYNTWRIDHQGRAECYPVCPGCGTTSGEPLPLAAINAGEIIEVTCSGCQRIHQYNFRHPDNILDPFDVSLLRDTSGQYVARVL